MKVTPGTSGRVSINARGRDGSQSLAPRELYTAETLSVTAGDVVSLEAINVAATYTDPAESGPALQALVSGGGISGNSQASFAILGDSLSCYCFGAVTITSATASGGVVTVAATGHGMVNGCTYAHYGANEDAFNVSGVTITRIDANSYSYPAPGATGTATGSQFGANLQNLSQHGYMGWARMLSANRPQIVYAGVQGGATAATIGTKYVAAALASGARNAVVLAGVNNAASAQTAAQIAAEIIASLVEPLVTQGVRVFLMAVWPFSSSHASFATAAPKIPAINETLRRYALGKAGVVWVDGFSALIDPLNATAGNALAGTMDVSNLHPTAKGAYLAGAKLAAAITAQPIPAVDLLVQANIDQRGRNAQSNNLLDCGLMQGATGTNNTITGTTLPTGWTGTISGTATASAAVTARADGYGSDVVLTITPGAANAQVLLNSQTGQLLGRVTAGGWYQLGVEVTATGVSASNLANVTAYLQVNLDGVAYTLGVANGYTSDTAATQDITALPLVSQPFYIPAGVTISAPLMNVTCRFSALSGSALTLKWGRATLRQLT